MAIPIRLQKSCMHIKEIKERLGTLIYDWPRFLAATWTGNWIQMRNRNDKVSFSQDQSGLRCDWVHTRPLHLCNVFPATASMLLDRALQIHPVVFKECPDFVSKRQVCLNGSTTKSDLPDVSFLIGHRGMERLPLLLVTLQTIAAQTGCLFECVVVEQDVESLIQYALPNWVKYLHSPPAVAENLYNRSQAFNDAAQVARGRVFVLHDNDMLVPVDYAAEVFRRYRQGYDVIQLKRFIFYLDKNSSDMVHKSSRLPGKVTCEQVIENLCGGGSVSVSAEAYKQIGGMDEDFVGWGGEDEEFWDRCLTCRVWEYGSLPVVHLWHGPQSGKRAVNGMGEHTAELTIRKRAVDPEQRIRALREQRGT